MKKIFFTTLLLAISFCINAQEISGKWIQETKEMKDGQEIINTEVLNLLENNSFELGITSDFSVPLDDGSECKCQMQILLSGKWSFSDGVLTKTADPKTLKLDFVGLPPEVAKEADRALKLVRMMLMPALKKECKAPEKHKILSLTEDSLSIQEIKPSKGSKSKVEKFTRVK